MKKMIKRIGAIALSCLTVFCVTACNWNWENTDGEFIYQYRKPGFTIEAGEGINPLPISQFNSIYHDNLGILILGMVL